MTVSEQVNQKIQDTPDGITNVTEWCKKESCWRGGQELQIPLNISVRKELIGSELKKELEKSAEKDQKMMNGIQSQAHVVEKGKAYWTQIRTWNDSVKIYSPKEIGILSQACMIPLKIPSEKQATVLIEMEKKAVEEGFPST